MELNYCNSTSSMQKHLKSVHQIELCSSSKSSKKRMIDSSNPVVFDEPIASTSHEVMNPTTSAEPVDATRPRTHGALKAYMEKLTSFSHGGWPYTEVTDTLLYMMAIHKLPVSLTERKGF